MIRTPTPEADEKNSFRLLHLLPLISKVRHLARSISWQAIDALSALAFTARILLVGGDAVVEKFCSHDQRTKCANIPAQGRYRPACYAAWRCRFCPHMSMPDAITAQQTRAGYAGRALACGAKRGRRWTALRASDKPTVLSSPPAQSTRLTCSVIDAVI